MSTVGWVVYSGVSASVVIVLGLLLWTLHEVAEREMSDGLVAADGHESRQLDNHGTTESETSPPRDPSNMLVIRPLPAAERTRFEDDWQSLQPLFVNNPDDAVKEADRLISAVMQRRGYPMKDLAQRAADSSLDPDVVNHYRHAHGLAQRAAEGQATTDEERRALIEYRELFDELVGDGQPKAAPAQSHAQTG